jgi:hypothetical protein
LSAKKADLNDNSIINYKVKIWTIINKTSQSNISLNNSIRVDEQHESLEDSQKQESPKVNQEEKQESENDE